ncbi:Bug family tripartite tricarboxylate transporter substrate binding protein [Plastoroseomonas arctica]|uniref:Tripartite tricarboxylate transporter substrate binding protein n=1 Tax=Plastoroseomonas arctica TaxID=1509237 RepID=A0AAF1JW92_9PROT|nr:tripartite tricarboxylate transporter substrate-binding protein [Plastoroseomonas arctica]MBR0654572.1 tripartite tricarboxylate transporter substrate binding protein [Plastoroseomonas arctica]
MTFTRRSLAGLLLAPAVASRRARAQPARALRIVVPFAPGGSLDILGRLYARHLGERLGWNVVVENRSGAGGNLGADLVAKARPDGTTVLLTSEPLAVAPALFPTLPYDPLRDLQPMALVARISQVLVTHPGYPPTNFAAMVTAARAAPETVLLGHTGPGSPGSLIAALLMLEGIRFALVPYRGGGPLVQDIVAGNIPAGIMTLPAALPFVREGTVKAYAVSSTHRSLFAPETPTTGEVVPGVTLDSWQGFFLPANTPAEIAARLNAAFTATTQLPAVRDWLLGQAFEPDFGGPAELGTLMATEIPRWRRIVQAAGLQTN